MGELSFTFDPSSSRPHLRNTSGLITPASRDMSSETPFPTDKGLGKPVCVFCGSSPGKLALYTKAAEAVGQALAKADIPLVYGGGRRGIMGVVSKSALQAGGHVHGVLPRALITRASERTPAPGSTSHSNGAARVSEPVSAELIRSQEGAGQDLLEDDIDGRLTMQVTESMHARKLKMAQLSTGGFVVLPGGYGTYEEMMEMITWNQLDIHRLPVLILNIANFYTPLKALVQNAVEAGFIAPQNVALCQIIDLPGGSDANADESKAEEWGSVTVEALNAWSFDKRTGYGLDWKGKKEAATNSTETSKNSDNQDFSLFTTMRYTTKDKAHVQKSDVPLLERHIRRLKLAHAHFSDEDSQRWGPWPGNDNLWLIIQSELSKADQGDWRVRVLLHPGPRIGVQVIPAPAGLAPFSYTPAEERPEKRRPLILDSEDYRPEAESSSQKGKRLYKTTDRRIYDEAGHRAALIYPDIDHPEVLLHTSEHLLESVTSNIAIQLLKTDGQLEWVTPRVDKDRLPFLNGVMRQYLLEEGIIREGDVTVEDWQASKAQGRRVIGFNGLRGVWEAQPM